MYLCTQIPQSFYHLAQAQPSDSSLETCHYIHSNFSPSSSLNAFTSENKSLLIVILIYESTRHSRTKSLSENVFEAGLDCCIPRCLSFSENLFCFSSLTAKIQTPVPVTFFYFSACFVSLNTADITTLIVGGSIFLFLKVTC